MNFRWRLKVDTVSIERMCAGREFQHLVRCFWTRNKIFVLTTLLSHWLTTRPHYLSRRDCADLSCKTKMYCRRVFALSVLSVSDKIRTEASSRRPRRTRLHATSGFSAWLEDMITARNLRCIVQQSLPSRENCAVVYKLT